MQSRCQPYLAPLEKRTPLPIVTLLLLALGLAADATAVSMTASLSAPRVRVRDAWVLAASFGAAQALMPVIGWAVGSRFAAEIEAWDHWVVLALLGGIGIKMVFDALKAKPPGEPSAANPFGFRAVAVTSLATSVDALAAGVTLPLLDVRILTAAVVIGAVTFVLCFAAAMLGQRLGARFGRNIVVAGGVLLIALGVKTVVDHVTARSRAAVSTQG